MEKKQFKKVSRKLLKILQGKSFEGTFLRRINREETDPEGEVVTTHTFILKNEQGEEFSFYGNKGFSRTFDDAEIKEGALIKIERETDREIGEGKRIGEYNIYVAD